MAGSAPLAPKQSSCSWPTSNQRTLTLISLRMIFAFPLFVVSEARTAQAVDGGAAEFERQAREQRRHARDVAVVFAGLIGAAVEQVSPSLPVDVLVALVQCRQGHGAEVVGAHTAERVAVATEGGANGVADEGLNHG